MKGIYLAAFEAYHPNHDIIYQDINGLRDLGGDMLDVDLSSYDFIIATPPCNYWSRCNYRRDISDYSLKTKHLLPGIIKNVTFKINLLLLRMYEIILYLKNMVYLMFHVLFILLVAILIGQMFYFVMI